MKAQAKSAGGLLLKMGSRDWSMCEIACVHELFHFIDQVIHLFFN
jgi:hypothetical protein